MRDFFLQDLGLLGLLAIPIIILIYLLKSKYTQKPVSSTFIWKRSLKYVKTRLPLNFTFSLLLILQLLMVILASLALARPTIIPFSQKDKIIILDSSASMNTMTDSGKTRYQLAIEKLQEEADSAGENNKITVIYAGQKADTLVERSVSKTEVINSVSGIVCEYGEADVDGALQLANNIQNINPEAQIFFYTDKTYLVQDGVTVQDFSTDTDANVCVSTLTDSFTGGKYIFSSIINNYSAIEQQVTVKFYIDTEIDGNINPRETRRNTFAIAPDSKIPVIFTNSEENVMEGEQFFQIDKISEYECVKIEIEATKDGLGADNSRTIYSATEKRTKILVVSENVTMMPTPEGEEVADSSRTTFLIAALRVLGYSLSNKTDIKKEISQVNGGRAIEGYDLYIFDGVMPPTLPDDGAVWFINPKQSYDENDNVMPIPGTTIQIQGAEPWEADVANGDSAFKFLPEVESDTDAYKTLTANIGGENGERKIYVGSFFEIQDTSGEEGKYESIFTCEGNGITKTVMLAGKEANVRVLCLSMDLSKTNLTMLIDFPMLIGNMVSYSLPDVIAQRAFEVGQTVKFNAPVGSTSMEFKYGDNILDSLDAKDTEFTLDQIGDYSIEVTFGSENDDEVTKKSYRLPTSIPAGESDIVVGGATIIAIPVTTTTVVEPDPMEIWPYIIMAFLALAIIEWGVYYRDEF